jgi:hypothetical protein
MYDHWPDQAGWYWVRTKRRGAPGDLSFRWDSWHIVEVLHDGDDLVYPFTPSPHLKTEWRGPIPEPTD